MSVVIIGGNERMEQQYKQICKRYRCKAKVFTRMSGNLKTQIGQPDLIILFTSTVAHKMVHCALKEAQRYNIPVERAHSSSASALENVLLECCRQAKGRQMFKREQSLFFLRSKHDTMWYTRAKGSCKRQQKEDLADELCR